MSTIIIMEAACPLPSALQLAVSRGHAEIVRALLEAGASPDRRQPGEHTPLINAASEGHLEVVRQLVEAGADLSIECYEGTALDYARHSRHTEVVQYLESIGA